MSRDKCVYSPCLCVFVCECECVYVHACICACVRGGMTWVDASRRRNLFPVGRCRQSGPVNLWTVRGVPVARSPERPRICCFALCPSAAGRARAGACRGCDARVLLRLRCARRYLRSWGTRHAGASLLARCARRARLHEWPSAPGDWAGRTDGGEICELNAQAKPTDGCVTPCAAAARKPACRRSRWGGGTDTDTPWNGGSHRRPAVRGPAGCAAWRGTACIPRRRVRGAR